MFARPAVPPTRFPACGHSRPAFSESSRSISRHIPKPALRWPSSTSTASPSQLLYRFTTHQNKTAANTANNQKTQNQPTHEPRTGLEPEDPVKLKVPDELIDRLLPMLTLHLGQDQLGRIAVVEAAEIGLYLEQLFCAVECHVCG